MPRGDSLHSNVSVVTPSVVAASSRPQSKHPSLKEAKPILESTQQRAARELNESYAYLSQVGMKGGSSPWTQPLRPPPDPKAGKVLKFTTLGSICHHSVVQQAGAHSLAAPRSGSMSMARSSSEPNVGQETYRVKTPVWAESAALRELVASGGEGAGVVNPFVARFLHRKQCGGIYAGSYFGAQKVNHGFDP